MCSPVSLSLSKHIAMTTDDAPVDDDLIDSFMAVIYFVNCTLMQSCVPSAMGGLKRFLAKKTILVLAIVY